MYVVSTGMSVHTSFEPIAGTPGPRRVFPDFAVKQTSYAPGTSLPRHSHESPIFSFAIAGGTEVSHGHSTDWCDEGSLLYLAPGDTHANLYPQQSVRLHLEVGDAFWRSFAPGIDVRSGPVRHTFAATVGREIQAAIHLDRNLAEFTIMANLLDAIGLLRARSPLHPETGAWLRRVRDYLEAHFAENLDLTALATLAGRHPAHLSRAFRLHFGRSMSDFVRERRLLRAARLIGEGARPLSEIALECGYYDQSHFTRAFGRFMKATPRQYRRP